MTRPWTRVSFVSPTGTQHYSTLVESLALNDTIHSENFYRIENLAVTSLDDKCTVHGKHFSLTVGFLEVSSIALIPANIYELG